MVYPLSYHIPVFAYPAHRTISSFLWDVVVEGYSSWDLLSGKQFRLIHPFGSGKINEVRPLDRFDSTAGGAIGSVLRILKIGVLYLVGVTGTLIARQFLWSIQLNSEQQTIAKVSAVATAVFLAIEVAVQCAKKYYRNQARFQYFPCPAVLSIPKEKWYQLSFETREQIRHLSGLLKSFNKFFRNSCHTTNYQALIHFVETRDLKSGDCEFLSKLLDNKFVTTDELSSLGSHWDLFVRNKDTITLLINNDRYKWSLMKEFIEHFKKSFSSSMGVLLEILKSCSQEDGPSHVIPFAIQHCKGEKELKLLEAIVKKRFLPLSQLPKLAEFWPLFVNNGDAVNRILVKEAWPELSEVLRNFKEDFFKYLDLIIYLYNRAFSAPDPGFSHYGFPLYKDRYAAEKKDWTNLLFLSSRSRERLRYGNAITSLMDKGISLLDALDYFNSNRSPDFELKLMIILQNFPNINFRKVEYINEIRTHLDAIDSLSVFQIRNAAPSLQSFYIRVDFQTFLQNAKKLPTDEPQSAKNAVVQQKLERELVGMVEKLGPSLKPLSAKQSEKVGKLYVKFREAIQKKVKDPHQLFKLAGEGAPTGQYKKLALALHEDKIRGSCPELMKEATDLFQCLGKAKEILDSTSSSS